jgi:hypothetical protein
MEPIKKAVLITFILIGIAITTLLIVEIIIMALMKRKEPKLETKFKFIRTIYLKYDLNENKLVFSFHDKKLDIIKMNVVDFESTLKIQKLAAWHQFIDNCNNGVKNSSPLSIQLSFNNNSEESNWYSMSFIRKNPTTNCMYFVLTIENTGEEDVIKEITSIPFDIFKDDVRKLCDDAYSTCGSLFCIYLSSYDNLKNRYSKDIADRYLSTLLNRLNTLSSKTVVVSFSDNYLWIYKHHLVIKGQIRQFLKSIKNTLNHDIEYQDLVLRVEYIIGYTIIGKFTFSVEMAINQAMQACQSKLNSVFGSSKEYLEFDKSMEDQNSSNYMNFQTLKQIIAKQDFYPVFNYIVSIYDGIINEFYIDQAISPNQRFSDYESAYACAVKNKLVDSFIEAAFKKTLNTIIKQKAQPNVSFIYKCGINHVEKLIDIYLSNSSYKAHPFMFALDNFDFVSDNNVYNQIKDRLLNYKDKGIKFALVVDEKMKMVSHPIFTLFDSFIIPPTLYKDIKKSEKAKLTVIRMIEILPSISNVIVVGVNDKIEIEILMNGDIDYFCGPIIGNTQDINEKADVVATRKIQNLMKYKENLELYEE